MFQKKNVQEETHLTNVSKNKTNKISDNVKKFLLFYLVILRNKKLYLGTDGKIWYFWIKNIFIFSIQL